MLALILLVIAAPQKTPAQINNSATAIPPQGQTESTEKVVEQPVTQIAPTPETQPVVEPVEVVEIPQTAPVSEDEAKNFIYQHESSMRLDAVNSIGACGLGQSLPCSKLANDCPDWQTNYACQDAWFGNYMMNRYGSWENARAFWIQHNWW